MLESHKDFDGFMTYRGTKRCAGESLASFRFFTCLFKILTASFAVPFILSSIPCNISKLFIVSPVQ